MSAAALEPGARVELKPAVVPIVRPRGKPTGEVVGEQGDCWKVRFDGTRTTRRIFKPYCQREAA